MPALCFPTKVEIEFQRTNVALGKPVDHEKLFALVEEHEMDCIEAIRVSKLDYQEAASNGRCMSDAIIDSVKDLDGVMNDFTLNILDRLTKIDRHEVVKVLKEGMTKIRAASERIEKSRH